MEFLQFSHQDELSSAMANQISRALMQDITSQNQASMAVSGGRSPIPIFQRLSEQELPWEKVSITLVDERWVDREHQDSNEKLVLDYLLQGRAKVARLIPLKNNFASPREGQVELEKSLADLPALFTLCVLGMGEDGHTASFFPDAPTLPLAMDLQNPKPCQFVIPPKAPHPRMTLTLPRILSSKHIILQLSGRGKKEVYERAMFGDDAVETLPVKSILHQDQTPVTVYWAP